MSRQSMCIAVSTVMAIICIAVFAIVRKSMDCRAK